MHLVTFLFIDSLLYLLHTMQYLRTSLHSVTHTHTYIYTLSPLLHHLHHDRRGSLILDTSTTPHTPQLNSRVTYTPLIMARQENHKLVDSYNYSYRGERNPSSSSSSSASSSKESSRTSSPKQPVVVVVHKPSGLVPTDEPSSRDALYGRRRR